MEIKKSQTATEYLIILAVVIVIALIVVSVMGGIPSIGGGASNNAKLLSLGSEKAGIVKVLSTEDGLKLKVKNNHDSSMRLEAIYVNNLPCVSSDLPKILKLGESIDLTCDNLNDNVISSKEIPDINIVWEDIKTNGEYVTGDALDEKDAIDCFWASNKTGCLKYYIVNGCGDGTNETVLDSITGLCFQRDFSVGGSKNWTDALDYCNNLVWAGRDDWYLPTKRELLRVVDYGRDFSTERPLIVGGNNNIFTDVVDSSYWSSSITGDSGSSCNSVFAWEVDFYSGFGYSNTITNSSRVMCVSRNI